MPTQENRIDAYYRIPWIDLSGKVAWVLGGAGLLGTEVCRALAEHGARVIVSDVREDDAAARGAGRGVAADGLLDLCIVRPMGHSDFLRLLPDLRSGEHVRNENVIYRLSGVNPAEEQGLKKYTLA